MVDLTEAAVREAADAYEHTAPFCGVESTALETFPKAVRTGDLRWRDAEWMVRWYYRRHLSSRYNRRRRRVEESFRANEWDLVKSTIESAVGLEAPDERVAALAALAGIDVGVATAILYFTSPGRDIVMAEPEWTVLNEAGRLDRPYPGDPQPTDYREYRQACVAIADGWAVDLVVLQRALWMLEADRHRA